MTTHGQDPGLSACGQAALSYAQDRGWRVLALVGGSKIPVHDEALQAHGSSSATRDAVLISELFRKHVNANVAIATGEESGIAVADYDGVHIAPKAKSAGLVAPASLAVQTRRGVHVYIDHHPAIPNKAKILDGGCACTDDMGRPKPCALDGRNEGGYVVAPPSVVDGFEYLVIRDLPVAPWPELAAYCESLAPRQVTRKPRDSARAGNLLIERVKAAWSIEELAQQIGARLRDHGRYLDAKCPLHAELRGHAFVVWPDSQRFECFGKCGLSGDVIDLYRHARERGLI